MQTQTFEYNALGNPVVYRGKTMYWEDDYKLLHYNGVTYHYDGMGRLVGKNNERYTYDSSGRIKFMNDIKTGERIEYLYDATGVTGMKAKMKTGTDYAELREYVFAKDVQGNIVSVLDSYGEVMLRYEYDAWGRCKIVKQNGEEAEYNASDPSCWVVFHNPFRYRGYFYDSVNGLYYLQTRFYDPELCRFISPDSLDYADPTTIGGVNFYSYCNNNPVMNIDPDGHAWYDVLAWIGVGLVAAAAIVLTAGMAGFVIGGIAGGIIYGAALGALVFGAIGSVGGAIGGMIYDAVEGNSFGTSIWTWVKAGFGIGTIAGAVIGGTIGGVAASSVTGLSNASFWTGLGKGGAEIAAKEAAKDGFITIGQTFGGKTVNFLSKLLGDKATHILWASLSKTMASTVSMSSVVLYYSGIINDKSIFKIFELPYLIKRGIDIIKIIIPGG